MMSIRNINVWPPLVTLGVLGLIALPVRAHSPGEEMAEAAQHFLAALSADQKSKAAFEWPDQERLNWHFVPRERRGLPFKEMTAAQRQLAQALLASGLSRRGYLKALTIMSLEQVLRELEGPQSRLARDPELYYVSVFGRPGATLTWGWRVEGHHLSVNITVVEGEHIAATPSFFGSNPAAVRDGSRQGLRVLGAEEDLARRLVRSLEEGQRAVAVISEQAPPDIITGAARKAALLKPEGLAAARLDQGQRALLWELIREYVHRHRLEVAEEDLGKIKAAGEENLYFAWAGGLEKGQGHYYRIQGPTFVMEYDCTQNDANHIHAVWRDLENDFGGDLLRQHYRQDPHPR